MAQHTPTSQSEGPTANRRSFGTVVAALATGAVAMLTPLGVGLASFFSPLRRKASASTVRVALLEQIPDDGVPRSFAVIADRVDAWNRYPAQRIGAVYLVRKPGEKTPTAFTAKCPHAGCFIGYTPGEDAFKCPCHTSSFNLDGTRVRGDAEVSPRDMDPLKVDVRSVAATEGATIDEVWIEFVDYATGHKERIPTV
jgi:menaquinol-cytochrome c reductase iron-sulfur subunit